MKDFYEILGISKDASLETIEAAYNTMSDGFLTNVSMDNILDTEAEKDKVKEAYAVLSDPAARQKYDLELSANSVVNDEPSKQVAAPAADAVATPAAAAATEAEEALRQERAKALLNQKIYNDNFEPDEPVLNPQKSKKKIFLWVGGIAVFVLALIVLAGLFHNEDNNLGIDTGTSVTTAPQTSETTSVVGTTSNQNATTTKSGVPTTSPVNEATMPTGSHIEVTTGKDGMPVNSNLERVMGAILKSSTYTMKFEIEMDQNGTVQTLPVTAAVSGKKTSLETKMNMGTGDISVRLLSTGTNYYAIIPSLKAYMKLPAAEFKDYFPDVLNSNKTTIKYVGTTNVTYKGVKYICETYKGGDGTVTKYYFNGGNLKRIEIIDKDGSSSILENVSFSATVDESIFKLPTGYKDWTALGGLGG